MICPICGKNFSEPPALSRIDNKTMICPDCGIIQALQAAGMKEEQIEDIIKEMRR